MNSLSKCNVIGYLFLVLATAIELFAFYTLLDHWIKSWFGMFCIAVVLIFFNCAIWWFARKTGRSRSNIRKTLEKRRM